MNEPCEKAIFSKKNKLEDNCEIYYSSDKTIFLKELRRENQSIFSTHKDTKLNFKCSSQDREISLQNVGIITIPNTCRAYYEGRLISGHGQKAIQNKTKIDDKDKRIPNAELSLEKLLGGEKGTLETFMKNNYDVHKFNLFNGRMDCYNELPVKWKEENYYLAPKTRILLRTGTRIYCDLRLPSMFKMTPDT